MAAALVACGPGVISIDEGPGVSSGGTTPSSTTLPTPPPPTASTLSTSTPTVPLVAQDYHLPGPYTTSQRTGSSEVSCNAGWTLYQPQGFDPLALVVLAHGIPRSQDQMAGWASQWASWGLAVVTPDLCSNPAFGSADAVQNAADLIGIAADLDTALPVLYAGFGGGGLASFLAAVQDPSAEAQLGLDLVDDQGQAADAADLMAVPAYGLIADASDCNQQNNADDAYRGVADAVVLHVLGAGHCDYENPTDWGCTTFCSNSGDPAIQAAILGLSTAFVLWRSGTDPGAALWWTPGSTWYDQLVDSGVLPQP